MGGNVGLLVVCGELDASIKVDSKLDEPGREVQPIHFMNRTQRRRGMVGFLAVGSELNMIRLESSQRGAQSKWCG